MTTEERFWSKVVRSGPNDCWPWTGEKGYKGYGRFCPDGSLKHGRKQAHRVAWEYTFGTPIPEDLHCCHHCDNPPCCNPTHLFIGTHSDNMRDMKIKGRAKTMRGEAHPIAKLDSEKVREIRQLYRSGQGSQPSLAKQFGVSSRLIFNIVHRTAWPHVA